MKKLVVYLTLPMFLCATQACHNNAASTSTTTDTTTAAYSDTTLPQNADTASTDTTRGKNAVRVDAAEVPAGVTSAFNSKYPNVADVKWVKAEKKGKAFYKARWQANGQKMVAIFGNDGSFIKEKQGS